MKILTKPKNGWAILCLPIHLYNSNEGSVDYVKWNISYGYNTPIDILTTFINYHKTKIPQICRFDLEEKGTGSMILTNTMLELVNTSEENPNVYRLNDVKLIETTKQLISDLITEIDAWSSFYCLLDSSEQILANKEHMMNLINELKTLI